MTLQLKMKRIGVVLMVVGVVLAMGLVANTFAMETRIRRIAEDTTRAFQEGRFTLAPDGSLTLNSEALAELGQSPLYAIYLHRYFASSLPLVLILAGGIVLMRSRPSSRSS